MQTFSALHFSYLAQLTRLCERQQSLSNPISVFDLPLHFESDRFSLMSVLPKHKTQVLKSRSTGIPDIERIRPSQLRNSGGCATRTVQSVRQPQSRRYRVVVVIHCESEYLHGVIILIEAVVDAAQNVQALQVRRNHLN